MTAFQLSLAMPASSREFHQITDQINFGEFPGVVPVGDVGGGVDAVDEQSGCDCVFVLLAIEQKHLH